MNTPREYANHLARYISDPSTVRVRVIEAFGPDRYIPTKAEIAAMRDKHVRKVERFRRRYENIGRPLA